MEALKLAFDTIIVGALALPWIVLILDLLLLPKNGGNGHLAKAWAIVKQGDKVPFAVTGVFLFATAYFVGAAVERVSGDFFDDELGAWFPAEHNIRTEVYCHAGKPYVEGPSLPAITLESICPDGQSSVTGDKEKEENEILQVFRLQEAALIQQGETDRLGQLHAQILVLRGAAFDGLIVLMLCLIGWCQQGRRRFKPLLPIVLLVAGVILMALHTQHHGYLTDPPFMEFTILLAGVTSWLAVRKDAPRREVYSNGFWVALLMVGIAVFGWWWSEVHYDQAVLYSFYAQRNNLLHPVK